VFSQTDNEPRAMKYKRQSTNTTSRKEAMRIHNIYADEDGESHFRDVAIEWSETGPDGTTSKRFPATGIIFRSTPGGWRYDWHVATRSQYVINLDGPNRITTSDGESRIIGSGEVLLIEDLEGKGHISESIDGKFRHSILIPID
jgi:uncharacterized cupin superfamily protein